MTRRLLPLALISLLAACGGTSSSPDATAPPPRPTSSASSSSTPSPDPGAAPFVPQHARATTETWHLPYAAGRQAVVATGPGVVLVAGGLIAGDQSTDRVVRVDLTRARVSMAPFLPVPVHDVAGGLAGAVPLVVGGGNAAEQDVVQALTGGTWRVVGHLPVTRSDLSVVQRGTTPLVLGGYDGTGTPLNVLALSADGASRPVGQLVEGVRYAATAVAGHTAYVFGGEVLGRELDAVQAVDLRTGHTRELGHLPVPLGHAMAATVGERILLIGGRVSPDQQTGSMWWFDPRTARFSPAGHLPHPLSDAAVTTTARDVWLLGGESPDVTDQVVRVHVS